MVIGLELKWLAVADLYLLDKYYFTSKARKAADLIYKNANIYLDRKYNIYINKFCRH